MINKIFTVYDQKAHAYLPPFFLPQEGMAIRTFADCVNKPDHQFNAHPEDYNLAEIGTFNDENGEITPYEIAKQYGSGLEFINSEIPET
mgnify:CR=1 FL=1